MAYGQPPKQKPTYNDDTFVQWKFSSHLWVNSNHDEDLIKVTFLADTNEWAAVTERDHNVIRNLDTSQIADLREAFGLNEWLLIHQPSCLSERSASPMGF